MLNVPRSQSWGEIPASFTSEKHAEKHGGRHQNAKACAVDTKGDVIFKRDAGIPYTFVPKLPKRLPACYLRNKACRISKVMSG
jgi:hypothetical protein